MRLAYADPPYPGKARLYRENTEVDHVELITKLSEYDGWALSTDEKNLRYVLSLCPPAVRVLAWCRPDTFPFHGPWRSWEPVLCMPARPTVAQVASYFVCNAPPRGFCADKTFTGSKPAAFCLWVIRCLGSEREDTLDDLFPGTGVMGSAWQQFKDQPPLFDPYTLSHVGRMQVLRRTHPQLPGMPDAKVTPERQDPDRNVA